MNGEQAEIQRARASAREKLLTELRGLPARERLEHIAWDDTRSLSCYPADLAVCTSEDLQQLDPVTRERLIAKLRERKKGPRHKLAMELGIYGLISLLITISTSDEIITINEIRGADFT